MTPPPPSFACLEVGFHDGVLQARSESGEYRPVRNGGQPVRTLNHGWSALHLVDLGVGVGLLELLSKDGHRATWFLDAGLDRIADQLAHLAPHQRDTLLGVMLPYLHAIYHELLASPEPSPPPGAAVVARIAMPTMINMVHPLLGRIAPGLKARRPGSAQSNADGLRADSLAPPLQAALDRRLGGGPLLWPSPFDGTARTGADSIPVHEHRIGYRFGGKRGEIFYVGAAQSVFQATDLFLPEQQCLIADVADDTRDHGPWISVVVDYLAHAAIHAEALCHYLSRTARQPAVIMRGYPGMHMGHHVWNELTALDRLQRTLPADSLPRIFVPDSDAGSEPFAPIDEILPAFEGKVDRTHTYRKEPLGSLTYRENLFLVRSMDEHVSTHLSDRIRAVSLQQPAGRLARTAAQDLLDRGYTIITLGMRVENRTATDIVSVAQSIIDHLSSRIRKLAIVLDGQNARLDDDPSTCFGSHGQPADRNPLLLEFDLALKLRRHYAYTDVVIVSTIGASTPKSIAWCDASSAFVACWGAGFAKYRWVCNKPGLALSGRWNLLHRHDLHIYDFPEWQENPTTLVYIDPADVTDRPDLGVYFAIVNPVPITYSNFEIDPDGLRRHLDRLVDSLAPG